MNTRTRLRSLLAVAGIIAAPCAGFRQGPALGSVSRRSAARPAAKVAPVLAEYAMIAHAILRAEAERAIAIVHAADMAEFIRVEAAHRAPLFATSV